MVCGSSERMQETGKGVVLGGQCSVKEVLDFLQLQNQPIVSPIIGE
jgi:hypothetical protein